MCYALFCHFFYFFCIFFHFICHSGANQTSFFPLPPIPLKDLSTIRKKIEQQAYPAVVDYLRDLDLMINNAKVRLSLTLWLSLFSWKGYYHQYLHFHLPCAQQIFNRRESAVYKDAQRLAALFRTLQDLATKRRLTLHANQKSTCLTHAHTLAPFPFYPP